jgi:hypothetical protein
MEPKKRRWMQRHAGRTELHRQEKRRMCNSVSASPLSSLLISLSLSLSLSSGVKSVPMNSPRRCQSYLCTHDSGSGANRYIRTQHALHTPHCIIRTAAVGVTPILMRGAANRNHGMRRRRANRDVTKANWPTALPAPLLLWCLGSMTRCVLSLYVAWIAA